ncbi:MAG: AAA family ATPase [Gallionellales bacterium 35-53-114]|jgi:MSHA biogenesis protein MshM|nr:MAG: AAA family ATPase [Gallionellales bacterium 35-53-114]OYZ64383.1 MAG: AAA family ATPase [Gallionellales bacterium 24-53-125]OZB10308.1 MAG: AAA family ATPase [Gallionellales bacterium 39-52-133]HQS56909.1 AAA family ATPase [Gallionellaceae bacterium]HQS75307.1 AAA family ATPase [Gallionellaceae bacterium]
MYLAHFGLREQPFSLTPDTSFFFACTGYQEALNTLLVAARSGEGFIKIVGEVGNGKTMLCRKFLATLNDSESTTDIGTQNEAVASSRLKSKFATAYIPNPYLEPRSLLMALAGEFRIQLDPHVDQNLLLRGLTMALLNFAREGKRVLVCLDEAQAMPLESLEVLRLLTNLETEKRKLMQVVLFGQPELDERLKQNSVRQLRQRISFQYQLKGLHRDEIDRYLRHRMRVAGYSGETLFSRSAVWRMHRVTSGTPRLINIIAHKALMLAYGEGRQQVLDSHVRRAAKDTPEAKRDWLPWVLLGAGTLLLVALMVAGIMLL